MMRKNYLKEKLEAGKTVIGTWSVIPSPVVADVISTSGLDFLIIDTEHGPINYETAQNMIMACESREVSPAVRVPGLFSADILKALDIGAHCVHIPNIKNKNDVLKAVEYFKYPPKGNRGFSPFTRAGDYTVENATKLTKRANDSVLMAIHIEGKEAIENIDEILKIKEIDIVFIGLFDISKSLGIPGDVNNSKVIDALKSLVEKIKKSGKHPGSIVTDKDQLKKFIDYGVKYLTYSVDCDVIARRYKEIAEEFRGVNSG